MTQPAFLQAGTNATFTGLTSVNVPLPATVVDGELAILAVSCAFSVSGTITWPAGWTEIGQATQGGVDQYSGCAWKRLTAAEGGTQVAVAFSAAQNGCARIATFGNVRGGASVPYEGLTQLKGTSASMDSSPLTTTDRDRLGVIVNTMARSVLTTPPAGWSEHVDSGGGGARVVVDSKGLPAPGTEPAASTTIASDDWITWTLALLPEQPRRLLVG